MFDKFNGISGNNYSQARQGNIFRAGRGRGSNHPNAQPITRLRPSDQSSGQIIDYSQPQVTSKYSK